MNALAEEIHEYAKAKGWWDDRVLGPDPPAQQTLALLMLVCTEVAEAAEDVRFTGPINYWSRDDDGKPCGFPSELADIVIRVLDIAAAAEIDMDTIIAEKMAHNRIRPHRHGGKRA